MIFTVICYVILVATNSVWSFVVTDEEYGRLPPVFELDNFDNCMLLGKEALYCTIEFKLKPIDPKNETDTWKQIAELNHNPKNYRHDLLRHGICLPFTCPNITRGTAEDSEFRDELARCYSRKFENKGLYGTITSMNCQTSEPLPYDKYDRAVLMFIVMYLSLIAFASIYEGVARYKAKAEYDQITGTSYGKFLSCFSVVKNYYRLKSVKHCSETDSLKCIQGVRFFNMVLVILTHCIMGRLIGPVSNLKIAETFTDDFSNILLTAGSHAVQTFFLISAWLLTYHVLVSFENKKELNIKTLFWIFLNRYLRLAPSLTIVLALHATLLAHTSRGPFWDHIVGEEYRNCRKNGWTNLLFVNNYVNPTEMCIQQTWYIAADTQLFLLALFILAAMKKFKNMVKWILGISLGIGVAIPGVLAFLKNYDILIRAYPENLYKLMLNLEEWHVLYSAGYSNIGSYVIGIICGYLYYTYRNVNLVTAKIYVVLYYIASYGVGIAIIAIAFPMYSPSYVLSNIESAIYWSSGKNIFTLAVAVGIFGMTQGLGWFGLWLCRWNPLQVLGRLTYCVYLIHVFLLRVRVSSIRHPMYISKYLFFIGTIGDLAVAYLFGFILCLTFEMPVSALQKLWLPQKTKEINGGPQVLVLPKVIVEKEERL